VAAAEEEEKLGEGFWITTCVFLRAAVCLDVCLSVIAAEVLFSHVY